MANSGSEEIRALVEENRRLRRETRELGERVEALERSRWWRLHPRFLFGRAKDVKAEKEPDRREAWELEVGDEAEGIVGRFLDEVVARGDFARNYHTQHLPHLEALIAHLADKHARILEVGSFEGMSACYFLWRLPDAHVTCVDQFAWSLQGGEPSQELEAKFDHNVALIDATRVRKIVGDSRHVLVDLLEREQRHYDFIYVDGSHLALDVLIDGANAWRLLASGGVLLFDDYAWNDIGEDPLLRPGPAIDALLEILDFRYDLLQRGAQLAIRKH